MVGTTAAVASSLMWNSDVTMSSLPAVVSVYKDWLSKLSTVFIVSMLRVVIGFIRNGHTG